MKKLILIITLFACTLIVHAQTPLAENHNPFIRSDVQFQIGSIYNSFVPTHDSISAVNISEIGRYAKYGIRMNAPVSPEKPNSFVLIQDKTQGRVLQKGIVEGIRTAELKKDIFFVPVATSTQNFDFEGINYNIISNTNKTVEVTFKNPDYSGNINIPFMVSYSGVSYTVISIGDDAFSNCVNLTSVTIPSSVTNIGDAAFFYCKKLTSVTIPASVTSIGNSAFEECSSLTSVTIPNSVTNIGSYAFYNCTGLTSITIPSSVTYIGGRAFWNCGLINVDTANPNYTSQDGVLYDKSKTVLIQCPISKKGSFTIPSSVAKIGDYSFFKCSGLTSVSIPTSVTSIGDYSFFSSGLTFITIPSSVTSIGREAFQGTAWYKSQPDGMLYLNNWVIDYIGTMPANTSITINNGTVGIADYAFFVCNALTSVTIPNSVTNIGSYAFYNCCNALTSINIPNSVSSIGDHAFEACYELSSITVDANNQYYSSVGGILYNKNQTYLLCCPAGKIAGNFTIPSSVTNIEDGAFYACSGLTSVIIPNSVTSIGEGVFDCCLYLTSVSIPNSVTSIGENTFSSCYRLTSITIPNSVTSIGYGAFEYCIGLGSITLSNSLISIGLRAFSMCESLTSVTIPKSVTYIATRVFQECDKLTSITVDENNQYYSSLGGILYNKNQTYLLCYPAGKTDGSFTIPSSVTDIEMCAFQYCSKLTSVTIPNSVTSIGIEVFTHCSGLTSVTIPNSVTSIGGYGFGYCSGLISVTIPISVTSIEYNAFIYCSSLTEIICKNPTPPALGICVFGGVDNIGCVLKVPFGCKAAYQAAEQWKDFTNIVEMPTALPAVDNVKMSIFPNPVTDGFQIKGIEGTCNLNLTDLNGKLLLQKQVTPNEIVSMSILAHGMYLINLSNNGVIYKSKVIKK